MAYAITQGLLDDLERKSINLYLNGSKVTYARNAANGAALKMTAINGSVFSKVYFLDPVMLDDVLWTLDAAKLNATIATPNSSMKLYYEGTFVQPPFVALRINQQSIDKWAADNMVMSVGGMPVVDGQQIMGGVEVKLTVSGNYILKSASFTDPVTLEEQSFVVASDGKSGVLTFAYGKGSFSSTVMKYEVENVAPIFVKGSNSVYRIADADLEKFTQQRFTVPTTGDRVLDYGQFILGFIKLPFLINAENIIGSQIVKLGPASTGIRADLIDRDRMVFDLGTISTPAPKGSALDFEGTECVLHLPFANSVNIDPQYVIGQDLKIELSINLYDGGGDYNLTSSKIGAVFDTVTCMLDIAIPFANVEGGIPNKNNPSNVSVGVDNEIRTAFIEVKRTPLEMPDGFFTAAVAVEGALSGVSGYVEVENVALQVKATQTEKERIVNALKGGVIL